MLKRICLSIIGLFMLSSFAFAELVDNGDGTITDTVTGLMWQQVEADSMPWIAAIMHCENLTLAGHDDWRLPTRHELQSIVNYATYDPAIDTTIFRNITALSNSQCPFWSSTTCAQYTEYAWVLEFRDGSFNDRDKSNNYYVRAVRNIQ